MNKKWFLNYVKNVRKKCKIVNVLKKKKNQKRERKLPKESFPKKMKCTKIKKLPDTLTLCCNSLQRSPRPRSSKQMSKVT
jgi:hypothetical protein